MKLDLTPGICKTDQYNAWVFPGGEIHIKIDERMIPILSNDHCIDIVTRLNTSQDIMFLLLMVDVIKKDYKGFLIRLFLPYMPYQQADRNFGENESFSLKTMTNLINSMGLYEITVFDPHSDVCMGLLNNSVVMDNSKFILEVLFQMRDEYVAVSGFGEADTNILVKEGKFVDKRVTDNLIILSPDAGAYKKIFKLCEKIGFKGQIECCSKSRNHNTGELTIIVPKFDENKNVLIIDDIALGSNTFFNIRKELKNPKVFLAVSHGIFNDNVDKLETEFEKVFTTNSRRNESIGKNIKVVKIF